MEREVIKFIADYRGIEEATINGKSNFITDLGLTSYDVIEMTCELEETFNIEISNEDIARLETVGDVADYIKEKQVS